MKSTVVHAHAAQDAPSWRSDLPAGCSERDRALHNAVAVNTRGMEAVPTDLRDVLHDVATLRVLIDWADALDQRLIHYLPASARRKPGSSAPARNR